MRPEQIAFVEELNEESDIFVMQADGSQRLNLTQRPAQYAVDGETSGSRSALVSPSG